MRDKSKYIYIRSASLLLSKVATVGTSERCGTFYTKETKTKQQHVYWIRTKGRK